MTLNYYVAFHFFSQSSSVDMECVVSNRYYQVPIAVLSVNRFTIVPTGSGSFTIKRTREHTYAAGLCSRTPIATASPLAKADAGS